MATYKAEVGTAVTNYAGNNPSVVNGEVWYDSTNKDFKYQIPNVTSAGSWASVSSLNTARSYASGAGTTTAGIVFGGNLPPAGGNTETYNGSAWTEVNDLTTARYYGAGAGTSTAAIMIGASPSNKDVTELWN